MSLRPKVFPKVFQGSKKVTLLKKPIIALGVFDGVHQGHQAIFQQLQRRAQEVEGTAAVYTFDPHPVKVLAPHVAPPMLNSITQRVTLIQQQGIPVIIVEPFTHHFSQQTPEKFFKDVILKRLRASELFVGYNFTFGIHRSGTVDHLRKFGRDAGVVVHILSPFFQNEILVSSTQVRQLIIRGLLSQAEALLGRPYFMEGKVVRGKGVGGKKLGVHTANLKSDNDLLLPTGVYVTKTFIKGKKFKSVTNIGPNPTFGPHPVSIETHLLDVKKSLLGQKIHIEFLKKLREEIKFSSPSALATQIQKDLVSTRDYFKKRGLT
ncbi:MAG: bifunctional riboflavin kinase/FAD synthetase [Deltaproteobacteria bacterium]|nr:bifunctional riboflavin kinase/FAD synthetase [Deltaproteobacteria bacterium]